MHWDIEGRVLLQQNDNLYCIDWQNHMTFFPPLLIPGSCYRFTYTFAVAFVYIYIPLLMLLILIQILYLVRSFSKIYHIIFKFTYEKKYLLAVVNPFVLYFYIKLIYINGPYFANIWFQILLPIYILELMNICNKTKYLRIFFRGGWTDYSLLSIQSY